MRSPSRGLELKPIPFERVPLTPLPDAKEVPWSEWDQAVSALDAKSPDGLARALAEVSA